MTRKDYQLVADVLRSVSQEDDIDRETLLLVFNRLSRALQRDNERFDNETFFAAVYR